MRDKYSLNAAVTSPLKLSSSCEPGESFVPAMIDTIRGWIRGITRTRAIHEMRRSPALP